MNKKLFGPSGRQARLQDLYRQAEQGGNLPDVDPGLQQAFAADQRLRQELGRLAGRRAPVNPAMGRATFLAAVARKKSESLEEERSPIFGRLLTGRPLALLAAAGIFAGGAVTVGASGGVSGAAGNVQDVLGALHITDRTPNRDNTQLDGADQPKGSPTPAVEGTSRAVGGIPTENPQHQPADAAGTCEKGDTMVKTRPSGVAGNVPCQTSHGNDDSQNDKTRVADETPEAKATEPRAQSGDGGDKTPEANTTEPPAQSGDGAGKTSEANQTEPHDGSGGSADHTPVPHPTQTNHNASDH